MSLLIDIPFFSFLKGSHGSFPFSHNHHRRDENRRRKEGRKKEEEEYVFRGREKAGGRLERGMRQVEWTKQADIGLNMPKYFETGRYRVKYAEIWRNTPM